MKALPAVFLALTIVVWNPMPAIAATCESLSTLVLPDATITLTQEVAAGSFVPPVAGRGGRGAPPADALKSLP
ncbi:MAG TPA: hypothetical protein VH701_11655, partial [Vicinamibacterales bacterium]